jgi:WD40 repeat protein
MAGLVTLTSVAFNPSGTLLAGASNDGAVRLWDVTALRDPARSICTRFGPLSPEVWNVHASGDALLQEHLTVGSRPARRSLHGRTTCFPA